MLTCELCGEEYHEQYERVDLYDIRHSPFYCKAIKDCITLTSFKEQLLREGEQNV